MQFLLCHGGLGVLFGTLAWAVTCELKTQVATMARPHKLLRLVYTDGVLSSTHILVPESPKAKKTTPATL